MTVAVLGGGLGGLSATYYLLKKIPTQRIILIEGSNRCGGWIKSKILKDNIIFEQGPRTIRPRGAAAIETLALIEELNIADEIIPINSENPAGKNRMIYANGKLHMVPNSFSSLFKKQQPFSKPLYRYLLQDLFTPKKIVTDESIYDFTQRRFGTEIADYLVSSLVCGVCAGDAKKISVNFLMKTLFENEQKYGSVIKGMIKNIATYQDTGTQSNLLLKAKSEKWVVYSFRGGIETLTKALEKKVRKSNVNIEISTKCKNIELFPGHATIQNENGKVISSKHVVSSLPAESLGILVENQHPELADRLSRIKSVTVAVINFQFDEKLDITQGFGLLVPPKEKLPILGITFDSCCFPCNNNTVLTVMMGGSWFEELFGPKPDKNLLLDIAKTQLKTILNISREPNTVQVNILKNCIPQYEVGHNANITKINDYIKSHNLPISLCGSSYLGVGVNDVICSAKTAVQSL